jgi:hypothetical protein
MIVSNSEWYYHSKPRVKLYSSNSRLGLRICLDMSNMRRASKGCFTQGGESGDKTAAILSDFAETSKGHILHAYSE